MLTTEGPIPFGISQDLLRIFYCRLDLMKRNSRSRFIRWYYCLLRCDFSILLFCKHGLARTLFTRVEICDLFLSDWYNRLVLVVLFLNLTHSNIWTLVEISFSCSLSFIFLLFLKSPRPFGWSFWRQLCPSRWTLRVLLKCEIPGIHTLDINCEFSIHFPSFVASNLVI